MASLGTNLEDQHNIQTEERNAVQIECKRAPKSTSVDPHVDAVLPNSRQPIQNLRLQGIQTANPSRAPNLFPLALNLQQHLYSWQPQLNLKATAQEIEAQQKLRERTGKELLVLMGIAFEEKLAEDMEAGKFATPPIAANLFAENAPSLGVLENDLRMLAALEGPGFPPALAIAARKLHEEYDLCASEAAAAPKHPKQHLDLHPQANAPRET